MYLVEPQVPIKRFVFNYVSPVKKAILDFKDALELLEVGPPSSLLTDMFEVETTRSEEVDELLQLKIRHLKPGNSNVASWRIKLKLLNPLKDGTRQIEAILYSDETQYIYVVWDALEEVIKQRSAYISLVALYGHFAEPKIKFAATVENLTDFTSPLAKIIQFFACFEHCGCNLTDDFVSQATNVSKEALPTILRQLRDIRYDIRSHRTNSRIPENIYFCAYPFPELSAAYQVRKAV